MNGSLGELRLHELKTFQHIKSKPFYLLYCAASVVWHYGISGLKSKKAFLQRFIKTPEFFNVSSDIVKRFAQDRSVRAVLQTQGLFNAKIDGIPLVIYTDNTLLNSINKTFETLDAPRRLVDLERSLYKDADAIAVSASHVVDSLKHDYGIDERKIYNIFIGANSPALPELDRDRFKKQQILFVGIDWERKGGPTLVDAYIKLFRRFPHSRLTIVGCSPNIQHPNVRVLGRVSAAEVSRLMAESSIFCLPSLVEPSSVAVIEAARAGLPVVGTKCGGFLDSVVHGQTGLLVPPGDSDALTTALAQLLSDSQMCDDMGRQGMKWVSNRFDWEIVCQKLGSIIIAELDV